MVNCVQPVDAAKCAWQLRPLGLTTRGLGFKPVASKRRTLIIFSDVKLLLLEVNVHKWLWRTFVDLLGRKRPLGHCVGNALGDF